VLASPGDEEGRIIFAFHEHDRRSEIESGLPIRSYRLVPIFILIVPFT